jgi:hypothetical protein
MSALCRATLIGSLPVVLAARDEERGYICTLDPDDGFLAEWSRSKVQYAGLAVGGSSLYATVNEFTRSSEFVVGRSNDFGVSWDALMTVADLGRPLQRVPSVSVTTCIAWRSVGLPSQSATLPG